MMNLSYDGLYLRLLKEFGFLAGGVGRVVGWWAVKGIFVCSEFQTKPFLNNKE